ncbi:MAG: repeat-containing taxis protein [Clostridiales bacterium]|nr:repeat-containing taxis protein [Clostridiales bacterium]MDN5283132.1 repeat-containing taxis protein [Candidatus Ozemobacter sp.]
MEINLEKIKGLLNSDVIDERRSGIMFAVKFNAADLISRITEIAGSDPDQELRILARKALERLQSSAQAGRESDDKYEAVHFEQLLQSEDPYARFAGLKKAMQQSSDISRLCILSALDKEPIPQLKASMIIALGRFGREEDVEILADYLRDKDSRVRANTVESLASIGGEAANRYIIAMMADEDNRVKTNVVKALKGLGGPNLLELLRKMAQDERVWMRASAIFAFSRIKSPQSLVVLGQIAAGDPDEGNREKAIAAITSEKEKGNPAAGMILEKLQAVRGAPVQKTEQSIEKELLAEEDSDVRTLLLSEDPCKRYLAVDKISVEFEKYEKDFVESFQRETDTFLLSMMLTVIRDHKPQNVINRCVQLLKHDDDRVRANAIEAAAAVEVASSADFIYPLLNDKNSRVAANAVVALGSIGRIDIYSEIKKLLNKGREAFRQSALYVISLQREEKYVALIEELLHDSSPRVRDKAYDILRVFVHEQVTGSHRLLQEVDQRINLEKSREHFFENSLDHMFSNLVHLIKSDSIEYEDKFVFERTPEAEKQALIQLALKSIEIGLADARTKASFEKIENDLVAIDNMITSVGDQNSSDQPIEEAARKMSEIQLLKIEKRSLNDRKDAMMVAYALDVYGGRKMLDFRSQAQLMVELARVEGSLCTHVPAGEFSMLPDDDASVSEIFDVSMRLYQKHVWTFSSVTGFAFFKWFVMFIIAAFFFGFFKAISPPIGLLFLVFAVPYLSYKSLGMLTEWKTLIAFMIDDFIHGREGLKEDWKARVEEYYPQVFSTALRKYFFLAAWFVTGMIISGTVFGGSEVFLGQGFLSSFGKLIGLLMFLFIVGSVYFKYLLIEPVCVLSPKSDAFVTVDKIYGRNKVKIATLVIFASFIMALITGYSLQALAIVIPVLPGKLSEILANGLALVSEVCLFPIIYSNMVIYSLMYFRKKSG